MQRPFLGVADIETNDMAMTVIDAYLYTGVLAPRVGPSLEWECHALENQI